MSRLKKKRFYQGISQKKATEILLNVFKDLPRKGINTLIKEIKSHKNISNCDLIFCKKCEKIKNMGIFYDIGLRTISSLSREFTPAVFDKLIKTAKEKLDSLFTDMTHLRRWRY